MSGFSFAQQMAMIGAFAACLMLAFALSAASLFEALAHARFARAAVRVRRLGDSRRTSPRVANDNTEPPRLRQVQG